MIVSLKIPEWAVVVADDALRNTINVVTPYLGHHLTVDKDVFNIYHSSCRMIVEQVFGMLVGNFGIYWRHMRTRLETFTKIIAVTFKLHNVIIEKAESDEFEVIPFHNENHVQGVPDVYLQKDLNIHRITKWADPKTKRGN